MMDQKSHIKSFISNLADKNYATADKILKAVVEAKIKDKIAKTTKKNLF